MQPVRTVEPVVQLVEDVRPVVQPVVQPDDVADLNIAATRICKVGSKMCNAITQGRKMFEILPALKKPIISNGTRLVGGPTGVKYEWPVSFVAVVERVASVRIEEAHRWLRQQGLINSMIPTELECMHQYIQQRVAAGDMQVHVVLFSVVHDVTGRDINLLESTYTHKLPHPRSSSVLSYLRPAMYWHDLVETWIE